MVSRSDPPVEVRIGELAADLYLPADIDERGEVPALVSVLPYRKDSALGLILGASALRWFAQHGYAALLVDVRGIGASTGALRPPFSPEEADDCVAAIEWAAAQSWCDGNVGMWGHSYGGLLTLRAAERKPRALKAIVPVEPLVDPWRDFIEPGGLEPLQWGALMLANGVDDQYFDALFTDRTWTPVDPSRVEVPALVFGGWRDIFCDATVRAYEAMCGPKQLVMGPWSHTMPNVAPIAPVDFLGLALRWFDRWLRNVDNGAENDPPLRLYVQGEGAWRSFDDDLDDFGALVDPVGPPVHQSPGGGGDGTDPTIGSCSGLYGSVSALPIATDQRDDDALSMCFDSHPLETPLTIVGRPVVDVEDAVVRICDVAPDGTSLLIAAHGWPTAYRVEAGHRLRVAISAADFPRRRRPYAAPKVDHIELRLPIASGCPIDVPPAPTLPDEVVAIGEWEPPHLVIERGKVTFSQGSTVNGVRTVHQVRATVEELAVTISVGEIVIHRALPLENRVD